MNNQKTNGDVRWAVFWAVDGAVDGAVSWVVDWPMRRDVNRAVDVPVWRARYENSGHPALQDFLRSIEVET